MTTAPRHLLVVCEGNHCRSPIAEALFRRELGARAAVASAGLAALLGEPAHAEAQAWASAHGLDLSAHRGRAFTPDAALAADLILVMDARQKRACEHLVPSVRGRVFLDLHSDAPPVRESADAGGRALGFAVYGVKLD